MVPHNSATAAVAAADTAGPVQQQISVRSFCEAWDNGIASEIADAATAFFSGVAPVLLGATTMLQSAAETTVIVVGWAGAS